MAISYIKLKHLLIDQDLSISAFKKFTGIGNGTVAKLLHNDYVDTNVLSKICGALCVKVGDIMEFKE